MSRLQAVKKLQIKQEQDLRFMDDANVDWYNETNTPFYFGGGIYVRTGSVTLNKDARLTSNVSGSGGGIAIGSSYDLNYGDTTEDKSAVLYVNGGIIGSNEATQRKGGGISTIYASNRL